jgi:hypothetical protein
MMFPSNRVRIVVATKPVDFRKGHDGLAALIKNELRKDPFTRCPAGDLQSKSAVRGDSFCVPLKTGRSDEAAVLRWHWFGHGLQKVGGAYLHLARDQRWADGLEPRSV